MADSILKIRTQDGDKPIGYPGLADKPVANKTLDTEGAFADAKVVGDKFKEVKVETDSLKEDIGDVPEKIGYQRTTQIFDVYSAKDSKAISSSTGGISDNENFWISGKIYAIKSTYISNRAIYKIAFYKQDGSFLSAESNKANNTELSIPDDCEFFILQFSKSNTSWDNRNIVIVSFGDTLPVSTDLYSNQRIDKIEKTIFPIKREKNYYGEKINLTQLTFDASDFNIDMSKENASSQSLCIYNGIALQFYNDGTFRVVDISSKTRTSSYSYDTQRTPHANCAFFGKEIPQGSILPYVYVNAYNNTSLPKGALYCYSISSDYAATLAQTITVGFTNDVIWTDGNDVRPYGNFTFNSITNELVAYTLRDTDKCTRFFVFDMPKISEGNKTLFKEDIKRTFDLPYFPVIQDCCCNLGKLYLLQGTVSSERKMQIIDLNAEKILTSVELSQINDSEPEGVDIYNGHIYYSDLSKFFELSF